MLVSQTLDGTTPAVYLSNYFQFSSVQGGGRNTCEMVAAASTLRKFEKPPSSPQGEVEVVVKEGSRGGGQVSDGRWAAQEATAEETFESRLVLVEGTCMQWYGVV